MEKYNFLIECHHLHSTDRDGMNQRYIYTEGGYTGFIYFPVEKTYGEDKILWSWFDSPPGCGGERIEDLLDTPKWFQYLVVKTMYDYYLEKYLGRY